MKYHKGEAIACWLFSVMILAIAIIYGSIPFYLFGILLAALATYHSDHYLSLKFGDEYLLRKGK